MHHLYTSVYISFTYHLCVIYLRLQYFRYFRLHTKNGRREGQHLLALPHLFLYILYRFFFVFHFHLLGMVTRARYSTFWVSAPSMLNKLAMTRVVLWTLTTHQPNAGVVMATCRGTTPTACTLYAAISELRRTLNAKEAARHLFKVIIDSEGARSMCPLDGAQRYQELMFYRLARWRSFVFEPS